MSRIKERIENFNNAFLLYKEAKDAYDLDNFNNIYKLALTQSFEIVFELAWKVLKDYLFTKGIEVFAPRDVIKEAFSIDVLPTAQIWIDMLNDRNSSTNEYNQDKVDMIIDRISKVYFNELSRFSEFLKDIND